MARNMPMSLFYEWVAYSQISPFGEKRADLRMGILAATISNTMIGLWSKRPRFRKPAEFIPEYGVKRKKTPQEIYQIFKMAIMSRVKTIDKTKGDRHG